MHLRDQLLVNLQLPTMHHMYKHFTLSFYITFVNLQDWQSRTHQRTAPGTPPGGSRPGRTADFTEQRHMQREVGTGICEGGCFGSIAELVMVKGWAGSAGGVSKDLT